MRHTNRGVIAILTVLALGPAHALAGTTGKLAGAVKDEKGAPLPGVAIRVEGQRLGALSDEQGNYFIIGIPAGAYTVKANLMGYSAFSAENVQIVPDFTTTLDISMRSEAVQIGEVRVEAERPLLQRDATSTTRFISADQIQRLPTRGYQEAAAQQAGIVNFQRLIDRESQNNPTLIIRGGRPNETAYYVDGFSQQDPLTGYSTTSINNNAIQEVVVLNGGFNAEYGRIMSGVVNVITKEGADRYSGALEALSDNFGGDNTVGAKTYDYNLYDFNLGGPILPGRNFGAFYFSGQRRYYGDRSPKANFDDPLESNSLAGWSFQGKLNFPLTEQLNLKLGGLTSDDDWREYLNSYRFNLAHTPRYEDVNRSVTGQVTHTLSKSAFYAVGASWFFTERKRGDGLYFDDVRRYGEFPQTNLIPEIPWFWPGTSDTNSALGKVLAAASAAAGGNGHVFDDYLRRQSSYWALRGDYTHQLNPFHQLKAGGQFDRHTLRFYQHFFPVEFYDPAGDSIKNTRDIDRYGFSVDGKDEVDEGRDGARHPITASFYAQDKYERGGLVVNAGLRWDYINTDVPALRSENTPLGGNSTLDDVDLVENKTYSRVSPRVGVGFPVSDRTVLHANWGQFFQQPNLQDLYVAYRFLEHKVRTGGYFVGFGNPNLKPERTTAYEVGIAHALSERAALDLTAYYKDVKDLVEIATIPSFPNNFASYRNRDFATIKGVDLGLTLRRVNNIAMNVNYSLSFAKGTGSVSNTQRNIAWTAGQPPKQTSPLDFDQRHKLSMNVDYALGKGEGPSWGGVRWLENLDLNVLYNVASGTPFTPSTPFDEVTLAAVASQPTGPVNSRYGPWTQSLDLKAARGFDWAGANVQAFVWVLNLLDEDNAITVFTSTGSANTTGYLSTPEGQDVANNLRNRYGLDAAQVYALALQNQALYSNPRQVRFGLRVGF